MSPHAFVFVLLPGRQRPTAVGYLRHGHRTMENGLTPQQHAYNLRVLRWWVVECTSANAGRKLISDWLRRGRANPLTDPSSYPGSRSGRVIASGAGGPP